MSSKRLQASASSGASLSRCSRLGGVADTGGSLRTDVTGTSVTIDQPHLQGNASVGGCRPAVAGTEGRARGRGRARPKTTNKTTGGLEQRMNADVLSRMLSGEIPENVAVGLVGGKAALEAKRGRESVPGREAVPAVHPGGAA